MEFDWTIAGRALVSVPFDDDRAHFAEPLGIARALPVVRIPRTDHPSRVCPVGAGAPAIDRAGAGRVVERSAFSTSPQTRSVSAGLGCFLALGRAVPFVISWHWLSALVAFAWGPDGQVRTAAVQAAQGRFAPAGQFVLLAFAPQERTPAPLADERHGRHPPHFSAARLADVALLDRSQTAKTLLDHVGLGE